MVNVGIAPGVAFEAAFYNALQSQHLDHAANGSMHQAGGRAPPDPLELAELLELMGQTGLPGNAQLLSSIQAALCNLIDDQHPGMTAQVALKQVQALLNLAALPTPQLFSKVGVLVLQAAADGDSRNQQGGVELLRQLCSITQAVADNPLVGPKFLKAAPRQEASSAGTPRDHLLHLQDILTSCTDPGTTEDQDLLLLRAQQLLSKVAEVGDCWQSQGGQCEDSLPESQVLSKPSRGSKKGGKKD
jgi:hypothetical protein